jgi:hypothetical protein
MQYGTVPDIILKEVTLLWIQLQADSSEAQEKFLLAEELLQECAADLDRAVQQHKT